MNKDFLRRTVEEAAGRIEAVKEEVAHVLFHNAIVPFLKEWKLYVTWGMGGVNFHEPGSDDNEYLEDIDMRIRDFVKEIDTLAEDGGLNENGHYDGMWWVLASIRSSGRTNERQEPVDYDESYYSHSIPPISDRKITFGDLEKGDSYYEIDFMHYSEVFKRIVEDKKVDEDGYVELITLNSPNDLVVLPRLQRASRYFTSEKKAEEVMELMFEHLDKYTDFIFQPDPLEKLMRALT